MDRKLLRNPELRRELIFYILITVIGAVAGFALRPMAGGLELLLGAAFCYMHLHFARRRYRQMEELSRTLDEILHGNEAIVIRENEEGELSILNSELQKMTTRLREQASQLTEDKIHLTEAIQDIFHQIRTPLTSMNLLASLLADEDLSYERRLQMTRDLRKQMERISWQVETLLKLSKIDAGTAKFEKGTVSVAELIDKAASPLRIPIELRDQSLELHIAEETFTGDLAWSAEALGNILKNAMEHTPKGGTISVRTSENALFTELVIEDTGSGFAAEDIPHLFERFYKGQNSSDESIGIGLALSRSIIAAQGGTIKAEDIKESIKEGTRESEIIRGGTAGGNVQGGARFVIRFYKSIV